MPPRILVADDDDGLRALLRLIFQREGFDVIEADSGEQTIARAIDSDPSVILLDIMMPGMDGYATCRQLKDDQRTGSVPVIFVSAAEDTHSRATAQKFGADDWIKKPVGPRELVARVRRVLDRCGFVWAA
jgi:DNA-binding response OmpR family regulator